MKKSCSNRRAAGIALAALTCAAVATWHGNARAATDSLLSNAGPSVAAIERAREVFPTPVGKPKPFRQTKFAACNLGGDVPEDLCRVKMTKVPRNRLVEVANISCFMSDDAVIILSTSSDFDDLRESIVAVVPSFEDLVSATNASGPYFFTRGEQIVFWGSSDAESVAGCTIYGYIHRTK